MKKTLIIILIFLTSINIKAFYPNVDMPSPASFAKITQKLNQGQEVYNQIMNLEKKLKQLTGQSGFQADISFSENTYMKLGGDIEDVKNQIEDIEEQIEELLDETKKTALNNGFEKNNLIAIEIYINRGMVNSEAQFRQLDLLKEIEMIENNINTLRNLVITYQRLQGELRSLKREQDENSGFSLPIRVELSHNAIMSILEGEAFSSENLEKLMPDYEQVATSLINRNDDINKIREDLNNLKQLKEGVKDKSIFEDISNQTNNKINLKIEQSKKEIELEARGKIDDKLEENFGGKTLTSNEEKEKKEVTQNTITKDRSNLNTLTLNDKRIEEIERELEKNPENKEKLENMLNERKVIQTQSLKREILRQNYTMNYQSWFPKENLRGWYQRDSEKILGLIDEFKHLEKMLNKAGEEFENNKKEMTPVSFREGVYFNELLKTKIILNNVKTLMDLNKLLNYYILMDLQSNINEKLER